MVGVILILSVLIVSQLVVSLLSLPVPASVIGMLMMFVGLVFFGSVPASLRMCSEFLLKVMPLCLVPAGVGLILYLDLIKSIWMPLLLTLALSTFVTQLALMVLLKFLASRKSRSS